MEKDPQTDNYLDDDDDLKTIDIKKQNASTSVQWLCIPLDKFKIFKSQTQHKSD